MCKVLSLISRTEKKKKKKERKKKKEKGKNPCERVNISFSEL
jgi:hypothetical protein